MTPGAVDGAAAAPGAALGWFPFDYADHWRRAAGEALDALGLGPLETPSRVVLRMPGLALRAYHGGEGGGSLGPAVLLVPAPIKCSYIWDLAPGVSVVRQCLRRGLRTYLIDWQRPGSGDEELGLADYADRLIAECLRVVGAETGREGAVLVGHSLGGTFAAIFASLHPARVRGLALVAAPLHFGLGVGAVGSFNSLVPSAGRVASLFGNVPGSFLSLASAITAPMVFEASRWADWLASLADPAALRTHAQVERWMLDETPMARRLFGELMEQLYREDRFMRGTLLIGGRRAAAEAVAAPLLSVVPSRCSIAPPGSMLPFHGAARSSDQRVLRYEGDVGVGIHHVGPLVGRSAHRHIWPEVTRWIRDRGAAERST